MSDEVEFDRVMIDWIKRRFDIEPFHVTQYFEGKMELSQRLVWMRWIPNGILMRWHQYTERERALMVDVAFHATWDYEEGGKIEKGRST